MSTKHYVVHVSHAGPRLTFSSGEHVFVRVRWAISAELLSTPPASPRTAANYWENTPAWVESGASAPVTLALDGPWWRSVRAIERVVYGVSEYRLESNATWTALNDHEFVINHDPVANAGPPRVIRLDANNQVAADIILDGSASDDVDLAAAAFPDPGPLKFNWWPAELPPSHLHEGPVHDAIANLASTEQPVWLAAGTAVAPRDRGPYAFEMQVRDNDTATLGLRAGTTGSDTAKTRLMLGPGGPDLALISPTTANRLYANWEDGIEIYITYSIGEAIARAYGGEWAVKCTLRQSIVSSLYPLAITNAIMHKSMRLSSDRVDHFVWDGMTTGLLGEAPAHGVGAFDVELELLDGGFQSTGIAGSVVVETQAIVIDLQRWIIPAGLSNLTARQTGSFMETGHAAPLHEGVDIGRSNPPPDILAARSGIYQAVPGSGVNRIVIDHGAPDHSQYLHGSNLDPMRANGTLVLQGERLATMSNVSPNNVPVHLHFEHWVDGPGPPLGPPMVAMNPMAVLPIEDGLRPTMDAVFVRAAAAGAANLTPSGPGGAEPASSRDISGAMDLIVRCRDQAHPVHVSDVFNGVYAVEIVEAGALWNERIEFDRLDPAAQRGDFYAATIPGAPLHTNHYLPYLRRNTAAYGRRGGPLTIQVRVWDHRGGLRARDVTIGPEAALAAGAVPQMSAASPQPAHVRITVTNRTAGLQQRPEEGPAAVGLALDYAGDNFYVELDGAPAGWTIAPPRTGTVAAGAASTVDFTIDPHGAASAGTQVFNVVISSGILRDIGTAVATTIQVA